jgi:hypothetical protein
MSATSHHHSEQEEISVNLTRLDARIGVLENGFSTLALKIDSLSNLFNSSRATNWPLLLTVLSLFCTLAVGVWYFIEIKVRLNSAEALAPVLVQNALSVTERTELRTEIVGNRAQIATLQQESARMFEKTREIEGQFKKLGDAHNTHVAEQARVNYVIWSATGKLGEYPQGPYYFPSFSQHLPTP